MRFVLLVTISVAVLTLGVSDAIAQLRVATYNTLGGPNPGMATVLEGIGSEVVNGFARPLDILLLQEQQSPFTTTQAILNQLNAIHGAVYRRSSLVTGPGSSSLRQSVIFNTQTVALLEEEDIGEAGAPPLQPREALRLLFRPVGYDSRADFYVYNSHFKARGGASDFARRTAEARVLRADADALSEGVHVIFAGDFNLRGSNDDAFQELLRPGASQPFDPADFPGVWKNNPLAAPVHTHGSGEVDDRFDFQLPTTEWRDGEGLDLIEGSYRTFGNGGSVYNLPVDSSANSYPLELAPGSGVTRQGVLEALRTASDHLPVVADYQLPAALSASLETPSSRLVIGEPAMLSLVVSNEAPVDSPLGADELDYQVDWNAAFLGALQGVDLADDTPQRHEILLDTSTLGAKTAVVSVLTESDAAANPSVTLTFSYEVFLPGDFNHDGLVDAADYTAWRDGLGDTFTQADYATWANHYGVTALGASNAVPEPSTAALTLLIVASTSRCWNRLTGVTLAWL